MFNFSTLETDGAGEQAKPIFLIGEDALDICADGRISGICPLLA
jgi:hypothetical protein